MGDAGIQTKLVGKIASALIYPATRVLTDADPGTNLDTIDHFLQYLDGTFRSNETTTRWMAFNATLTTVRQSETFDNYMMQFESNWHQLARGGTTLDEVKGMMALRSSGISSESMVIS